MEVVETFPPEPESVAAARSLVARSLAEWGCDVDLVADVRIVTSELATNAVEHARTSMDVGLERRDGHLRLTVTDHARLAARMGEAEDPGGGGRGLGIVRSLCSRWGIRVHNASKTIWVEWDMAARAARVLAGA